MHGSQSCISIPVELSDGLFDRVPYGRESRYGRAAARRGPCGDCGVGAGGTHHLGCDLEECPRCHQQFFSCMCRDADDEDADDDEWIAS
jgi:hypothetical protein